VKERIEVLAIGDELLDGRVADTNTVRLAQALSLVNGHIAQRTTVLDDIDAIVQAAQACVARGTTLCVVSGGLGPTTDDLTSEALARYAGVGLVRDEATAQAITERLQTLGRVVTANQLKQADRPKGAVLLPNPKGTAPGFSLNVQGCCFMAFPGVPYEFDAMVEASVITPRRMQEPREVRTLCCFGVAEAEIDTRLLPVHQKWPQVRVGYRVRFPEVHVTLRALPQDVGSLEEAYAFAVEQLQDALYAAEESTLAAQVLKHMRLSKATLAVAESCTGGLVQDMLTDEPGSSDVLLGGVVAYANSVKERVLKVPHEVLEKEGAVSEATVRAMAEGVRVLHGASYGAAVSGIAGPAGGCSSKPVGMTWVAVAGPQGTFAKMFQWPFDRRRNKVMSAYALLNLVRKQCV
jgi:nicotinamide-nucleotide amidase